ncbi:hypothetical protein Tco_0739665 [Tanacetum coccineum]
MLRQGNRLAGVSIKGVLSPRGRGGGRGVKEKQSVDVDVPTKGPTSYAKLVTSESSRKSVNFRTFIAPGGNRYDVAIPLESIRAISEYKYGLVKSMLSSSNGLFFFQFSSKDGLDAMLENGPWSSYARAIIEQRADEELKNTIVVAMPKLVGEGLICALYVLNMVNNFNNPRQATRGVTVVLNVSFKLTKQIYKHVSNKNGANTSCKRKQAKVSRQEVSNSNPFDALNSIYNDDDLGTNRVNSSSVRKGVASSSISTTPIAEMINKIKRQMIKEKLLLVDDKGTPLPKVVWMVNADSDIEVEKVFDEHATFMASTALKRGSDSGYGTNSLWEQWKEPKRDDHYDPYDDDLYDTHDMSDNLQAICDEFDITVRSRKMKYIHFDFC